MATTIIEQQYKILKTKKQCNKNFLKKKGCGTYIKWNSAVKKNKISPFAMAWIDPEGTMLSEMSQSEKDNII